EVWSGEGPMKRAPELARTVRDAVLVAVDVLRVVQVDVDQNLMRELVCGSAPDAFADRLDDGGAGRIPRRVGDRLTPEGSKAHRYDTTAERDPPRGSGDRQHSAGNVLDDADAIEASGLSGESNPQTGIRRLELRSGNRFNLRPLVLANRAANALEIAHRQVERDAIEPEARQDIMLLVAGRDENRGHADRNGNALHQPIECRLRQPFFTKPGGNEALEATLVREGFAIVMSSGLREMRPHGAE